MIRYTVGDTKPDAVFICEREGERIDFTVRVPQRIDVKVEKPSGSIVSRQASITNAARGEATVAWGAGDWSEAGEMWGEVVITWAVGEVEHGEVPLHFLVREEFNTQ